MGENSAIEWTDHTFNPWSGCTKVSAGCANCYAEKLASRFDTMGEWGPGAERKRTGEANWRKPLSWNRKAEGELRAWRGRLVAWAERAGCGAAEASFPLTKCSPEESIPGCVRCLERFPEPRPARPRVFCASLGDWLDPEVPDEWLADLLALIAATPHLDWLLLTKRPEIWEERMLAAASMNEAHGASDSQLEGGGFAGVWLLGEVPENVWIGTSVEDQAAADSRIPELLKIPARIRFLSCEPLLGLLDLANDDQATFCNVLGRHVPGECEHGLACRPRGFAEAVDWIIAGGESGPGSRPMHPDWARSLRDQCQEAGVFFLFKQWGAWETDRFDRERDDPEWRNLPTAKEEGKRWLNLAGGHGFHGERVVLAERKGKKKTGRLLDGRTWDQFPGGAP